MQDISKIIDCYNKTADKYAEKFLTELNEKPLDRILLRAFADQNLKRGRLIDLGCGPGHTTRFIHDHGFVSVLGTDLASEMVRVAKANHPLITFEQADMLKLNYANASFGSAVAFYSIVNFDYEQIAKALNEISRIL
jgi:ubiquinone/menaquinone biosynthesis C-methylase UbiE